ncbi:MAG TPA: hypothetical protein ENH11_08430 [Candidatus Acetothermia bacterium]|nr:hypothetical protein [Candidatus Acetothermia bacterium]
MVKSHPVVVVTGPGQVGKSSLLHQANPVRQWRYHSLDELDVQESDENVSLFTEMFQELPAVHTVTGSSV